MYCSLDRDHPNLCYLGRMTRPLTLFALASCNGDKPGEWSLFVYADAADHQKWQRTDRFQSEGMCKRAGEEAVAALPEPAKAGFECRRHRPARLIPERQRLRGQQLHPSPARFQRTAP